MGRHRSSCIAVMLILFILLLSLISIAFDLNGMLLDVESVLICTFLIMGVVSFAGVYLKKTCGWKILFVLFSAALVNLMIIYLDNFDFGKISLPLVISFLGLLLTIMKMKPSEIVHQNPVEKKVSHEKYLASKSGKKFHTPGCDWAKKISKKKQVWFNDKGEAKKQGYKACRCVK